MGALRSKLEPRGLSAKKLFLFDLDGVVYRGSQPIASAIGFLSELSRRGLPYCFLTNHAGKTPQAIADKLKAMGVILEADQVITSGQVAADALSRIDDARVLWLGTDALGQALDERNVVSTKTNPTHVLVGFLETISRSQIEEALSWLKAGAHLWGTNSDMSAPGMPYEHLECGSFTALLEHLIFKPATYLGKPAPEIFELALKRFGISPCDAVMIGDRLDTDIRGAQRAGITGILTLTGHTACCDQDQPNAPEYVVEDLSALNCLCWP